MDTKYLEEKLNIWENILKKKFENAKVNSELKELRENINSIIENRKKKLEITNSFKKSDESINQMENTKNLVNLSNNQRHSISGKLKSIIINDEEFEKIKREKLEKEYLSLLEEIQQLKEEVNNLIILNNFRIVC